MIFPKRLSYLKRQSHTHTCIHTYSFAPQSLSSKDEPKCRWNKSKQRIEVFFPHSIAATHRFGTLLSHNFIHGWRWLEEESRHRWKSFCTSILMRHTPIIYYMFRVVCGTPLERHPASENQTKSIINKYVYLVPVWYSNVCHLEWKEKAPTQDVDSLCVFDCVSVCVCVCE